MTAFASPSDQTAAQPGIDADAILKALANPVRRDILTWLKTPQAYFEESPGHTLEHGVCAGKIDDRCGLSQSTVSSHLAVLQRAGLVTSTKVGQWIFFRRNEPVIAAFLRQLNQDM
ncbi:metalloregulator ArsR/SmtB family transcription factor [Achromobacter seleniivolatilans]|uniref:Metalloregulator ArsR/SmtB family transcription factor n=1 Tax=Achromobacter seleniivolatilans TaxID=3047478 RepID=A0ABY9M6H6_9BURK|nr:metalloregulator ArsR/SmtB family transcription factor [Achromobacter sp. R39]WMD21808.1 metalloregulator ArsR/SmtB family transcription factor [Achromobacter sp. R39]